MKQCCRCKENKESCDFNKNRTTKDGLQDYCRDCQKLYDRNQYKTQLKRRINQKENRIKYYKRNRMFILNYLREHGCVHCPEKDPVVLTFDHIKGEKEFSISDGMQYGYSIKKLTKEIEKCQVLCANCHMRKSAQTLNWHCHTYTDDSSD